MSKDKVFIDFAKKKKKVKQRITQVSSQQNNLKSIVGLWWRLESQKLSALMIISVTIVFLYS